MRVVGTPASDVVQFVELGWVQGSKRNHYKFEWQDNFHIGGGICTTTLPEQAILFNGYCNF